MWTLSGRELTGGATPTRGNTSSSSSILFLLFNLLILPGPGRTPPFTLIKLKFAKNRDGKTQHYDFERAAFAVKMRQQTPIFCWRCGNGGAGHPKNANGCGGEPSWNGSPLDLFRIFCFFLPLPGLRYVLVFTGVFSSALFFHAQNLVRKCVSASFNLRQKPIKTRFCLPRRLHGTYLV